MTRPTYRDEPVRERSPWTDPMVIGGIVLGALVIGALLVILTRDPSTGSADGSGSGTPSPSGTTGASASEAPSASADASSSPAESGTPAPTEVAGGPAPVVEAPEGVIPPGSVARVTVDALRIREGPTTEAAEIETLANGSLVVVGYSHYHPGIGPVEAEGYTWMPVVYLGGTELPAAGDAPLEINSSPGWAAVTDGGDLWLEVVQPRCTEGEPDLTLISSLTEWERLACYGNRSMTLEGVFGCGGCGGLYPGTFDPEWLASPANFNLLSVEPNDYIGPLVLHVPPEVGAAPDPGSIVRATGHFDDPAAADCVVAPGEPEQIEIDPTYAALLCRAQFVVESFEVIGTDEDFPTG